MSPLGLLSFKLLAAVRSGQRLIGNSRPIVGLLGPLEFLGRLLLQVGDYFLFKVVFVLLFVSYFRLVFLLVSC